MKTFLSHFKAKKVYDLENNQIWEISGILFEIDFQKVVWFIYKKSFISYDVFLFEDIFLENEKWFFINLNKTKTEYYEIIWKNVKNEDFQNLWVVEDVEFDLTNKLKYIIVDCWYNFSNIEILSKTKISIKKDIRKISQKNIISYQKDYIVVKDKNFLKENKKTFENISKIFINIPNPNYNINPLKIWTIEELTKIKKY